MSLLRTTLRWDAAACLLAGAPLALMPEPSRALLTPLSTVEGIDLAWALRLLGVAVLAVGAWCWWLAARQRIGLAGVWPVLAVEAVWVVGGAVLLLEADARLTVFGTAVVCTSLVLVAVFFALEWTGLGMARGSEHLALATSTLLLVHQMDAAWWEEWRLFGLPGGLALYLALNVPIAATLLAAQAALARGGQVARRWVPRGLAACGAFAVVFHGVHLTAGDPAFRSAVSVALLACIGMLALALVAPQRPRSGEEPAVADARHGEHAQRRAASVESAASTTGSVAVGPVAAGSVTAGSTAARPRLAAVVSAMTPVGPDAAPSTVPRAGTHAARLIPRPEPAAPRSRA